MFYVHGVVGWQLVVGGSGDVRRIYLDRTRPDTHMHEKAPTLGVEGVDFLPGNG